MAHFADGTRAIVRGALDHDRRTARSVTFVMDLFILRAFELAGTALHGTLDGIATHVGIEPFVDRRPQSRVVCRIAAAGARSDGDFANDLGKDLAALGVGQPFTKANVFPFGMPGHAPTLLIKMCIDPARSLTLPSE